MKRTYRVHKSHTLTKRNTSRKVCENFIIPIHFEFEIFLILHKEGAFLYEKPFEFVEFLVNYSASKQHETSSLCEVSVGFLSFSN